ncbi:MAG TPA: hypothetical protein VFL85_04065 [Candidatus Saccharimonadales bacterium]|nr:hypothetical protein [Candidatus Saccharimonadales bacterium]
MTTTAHEAPATAPLATEEEAQLSFLDLLELTNTFNVLAKADPDNWFDGVATSGTAPASRGSHRRATAAAGTPASSTGDGMITATAVQPAPVAAGAVTSGRGTARKSRAASSPVTTLRQSGTTYTGTHGAAATTSAKSATAATASPVSARPKRTATISHKRDGIGDLVSLDCTGRARYVRAVERVPGNSDVEDVRKINGRFMSKHELDMIETFQDQIRDGLIARNEPGMAPQPAESEVALTDPRALELSDLADILPPKAMENLSDAEKARFLRIAQGALREHYQQPETIGHLTKAGLDEKAQWAKLTPDERLAMIDVLVRRNRAANDAIAVHSTTSQEASARPTGAERSFWERAKQKARALREKVHMPGKKAIAAATLGAIAFAGYFGGVHTLAEHAQHNPVASAPAHGHSADKAAGNARLDQGRHQANRQHSQHAATSHVDTHRAGAASGEWAPRKGEMPWNVLVRNGVPAGQIMHDLDQAAKRSGMDYEWHGSGKHKWLEVNGKSDTKSVMQYIGKQIINQR